ncbi:MAG TPA: hypothetical protein VKY74_18125, partial [Chloroflexia bacterium]|nr:hypothetical protein [Chloroflexia bacterium]
MKMYRRSRSQVATLVLLALVAMASWSLQGSQSGATLPAAGSARMGNSSFSAPAALAGAPGVGVSNTSHPTVVGQSLKNDVSPALRDIKPVPPVARATGREADDKGLRLPIVGHKDVADSVVQTGFGPPGASVSPMIPSPTGGWDGINMANGCGGCQPPDTNGQVGPNHFLQMVNSAFQIWNKSGTSLYGPANINTVWSGFGGLCETTNDGDPVALYDQLANRWLVSQFAFAISGQNPVAPYYQCIAVSQTADPTGAWYRYSFLMSNNAFPDYPKLSVWPDAYYMTINSFPDAGGNPTGMPYAFNRSQMLTGAATTFQTTGGSSDVLLPSNVDGTTLPPAGAPAYFLGLGSGLDFYKFHVDWNNSANTTFTGP